MDERAELAGLLQGHVGEMVQFLSKKLPWPHNLSISVIPLRNGQELNIFPLTAGGNMITHVSLFHTRSSGSGEPPLALRCN